MSNLDPSLAAGFDDIDEISIEELEDFVPFAPLPLGDYKLQFSYDREISDNGIPVYKVALTLQEVINIPEAANNPEYKMPEEGRKVYQSYYMKKKDGTKNGMSEGKLKMEILQPLREVFGGDKISEILHNGDGCSVIATLGIRKRKNKETGEIMFDNTIKALAVDTGEQ